MASVNKVILVGRLGDHPQSRYMPNGDCVCNIRVATSESWKDKTSGERKESVEWHSVSLFRKLGEIAAEYLQKGSLVYIEGKLKTRKWQDKEGIDRYSTEVHADVMNMLEKKQDDKPSDERATEKPANKASNAGDFEDDVPW